MPLLVRFRRIRPRDVLQDRRLARERRDVHPAIDRIVDDAQLPGMEVRIEIELDVVVPEQREAQRLDVECIARQERPAGQQRPVHVRKVSQRCRAVLVRFERDRIHEEITSHARRERAMHFDQPRSDGRAQALAGGVHHVDDHLPALHEVIVEAHRHVVVRAQRDVRDEIRGAAGPRALHAGVAARAHK